MNEFFDYIKDWIIAENIAKNIVRDLKKENFSIKHPREDKELEDYHKNSISFTFHRDLISIGNLDILWKDELLNHEISILKDQNKNKDNKHLLFKNERSVYKRPSIEDTLRELKHKNYQINKLLRSKLDLSIRSYLDYELISKFIDEFDKLKSKLHRDIFKYIEHKFVNDYLDNSCLSLLKKLYMHSIEEKFFSEGEQDPHICFITLNEHGIKKEFICCATYYDYEPDDFGELAQQYKDAAYEG